MGGVGDRGEGWDSRAVGQEGTEELEGQQGVGTARRFWVDLGVCMGCWWLWCAHGAPGPAALVPPVLGITCSKLTAHCIYTFASGCTPQFCGANKGVHCPPLPLLPPVLGRLTSRREGMA
jgi:hypothetical protein